MEQLEQEVKPRVCAHCKSVFTDERPLLAEFTVNEQKSCTRTNGEKVFDCIRRFVTSMGDGAYLDETKKQWNIDEVHYFSIVRCYHAECYELGRQEQQEQDFPRMRLAVELLLRFVAFDGITVQIVTPSPRLVEKMNRFTSRNRDAVKCVNNCLQVNSALGDFVIFFPTIDSTPMVDLEGTGIEAVDIRRVLESVPNPLTEIRRDHRTDIDVMDMMFPQSTCIKLMGDLFPVPVVYWCNYNFQLLLAFRQLLHQRQQVGL